jgi:hypothetical protein
MRFVRALSPIVGLALGLTLSMGVVSAQTESATAEDGKSAEEAPATTNTAPSVPIGANLTPPVGLTPPGPPLIHPAGTGQSGASSVSMAPGTLTSGAANEGANAVRAPEAPAPAPEAPAAAPEAPAAEPAGTACTDFPTWYDAQLALESSVDAVEIASLDPDGDTIACEEVMYPES